MDEKEMKSFLDKTGLPVAYSHFPDRYDYSVELYTEKKNIKSEEKLEGLLNSAGISFSSETMWLAESNIFVTYYSISTYKKIGV